MITLFFSYSHKDETLRDELEVHLSLLKKQGVIETWHDRRIGPGKEFEKEISEHLEKADIILLLVSPYFLASDYCYDIEMIRALKRHERGEARVIPVILDPCDWKTAPFGKLQAVPKDGKPVSKFPNQHDAFLEVVQAVRRAVAELKPGPSLEPEERQVDTSFTVQEVTRQIRSSNLRIRKEFSDRDKDEFLDQSFEFIANFFENSLSELADRNPEVDTKYKRIDAHHFSAIVYINGAIASQCRIWFSGRKSFGGIAYSSNASGDDNSINESLSVTDDGHSLFFKPLGLAFSGRSPVGNELLSQQGAAEYLWEILMRPLQ